jgi:hypothetical protein
VRRKTPPKGEYEDFVFDWRQASSCSGFSSLPSFLLAHCCSYFSRTSALTAAISIEASSSGDSFEEDWRTPPDEKASSGWHALILPHLNTDRQAATFEMRNVSVAAAAADKSDVAKSRSERRGLFQPRKKGAGVFKASCF